LKRRFTGRSIEYFVIRVLNKNQIFSLGPEMLIIVTPQNMNKCIVHYLYLPIYLWIKIYWSFQLGVHIIPKCIPKGTKKFGISIYDDDPWYPKMNLDIFKENISHILSFDGHFTRNEIHIMPNLSIPTIWQSCHFLIQSTHKIHVDAQPRYSRYK
jgi:hypothetical protein